MKKSAIFLKAVSKTAGLLTVLLALGLVLAGCGDDSDDGGGGGPDPALVAKWYTTQASADAGGTLGLAYEFTPDGKLLVAGTDTGLTFSTSGSQITLSSGGRTSAPVDYVINGTKLTISNAGISGLVNGDYYKK
jgi:hypothetical protein